MIKELKNTYNNLVGRVVTVEELPPQNPVVNTLVDTTTYMEPQLPLSAPSPIKDRQERKEWELLAKEIGVRIPPHKDALDELKDYLHQNGHKIYETNSVLKYMEGKCDKYQSLCLKPMRRVDWSKDLADLPTIDEHTNGVFVESRPRFAFTSSSFMHSPYEETIPYPVLRTAKDLIDKFGERVRFFILCISENPDPFLFASLDKGPAVCVDHWDEPGYRR